MSLPMDDIRSRNIARNNEFLQNLGFSIGSKNVQRKESNSLQGLNAKNDSKNQMKSAREVLCEMRKLFPARSEDLAALVDHFHTELYSFTCPLLLEGMSGCGKSSICKEFLKLYPGCSCYIRCDGYPTELMFFKELWIIIKKSIRETYKDQHDIFSSSTGDIDYIGILNKSPHDFIQFCSMLNNVLDRLQHNHNHIQTNNSSVRDSLENHTDSFWDIQDKDNNIRLLIVFDDFHKLSNINTKLIKHLFQLHQYCHPCIKVIAIAQRVQDLDVLRKLSMQYGTRHMSGYTLVEHADVAMHLVKKELQHLDRDDGEAEKDWDAISRTLRNEILPVLEVSTLHPQQTVRAVREVFPHLSCQSLSRTVESKKRNEKKQPIQLSQSRGGGMPVTQRITGMLSRPPVRLATIEMSGSTSRWQQVASDLESTSWCRSLPLVMRYVLISSYLASKIHKSKDRFIFSNDLKGRRKKRRIGEEEEEDDDTLGYSKIFEIERLFTIFIKIANTGFLAQKSARDFLSCRSNIQKMTSHEIMNEIEETYGQVELFSMVNSLVELGYLQSVNSTVHNVYTCNVSDEAAEALAKSLSIEISHYLY